MIITGIERNHDLAVMKAKMLGSLLYFTQVMYKIKNGRDFIVNDVIGREPHYITVCRELTDVFYLKKNRLIINVPPGHGKSTMLVYFIAWAFAHYPDCQFLYISYTHDLATKHTSAIKDIMSMPEYKKFFGVEIRQDSSAKDNFKTNHGGSVKAFGSEGAITGQDAGLPGLDRFSGGVIMDDMHKPSEVYSDTTRNTVIDNYGNTIVSRPRADNVPMIFIGQCLHQSDLAAYLKNNGDGASWFKCVLQSLDSAGNVLCPTVIGKERLLQIRDTQPNVFWAQYQQDPRPAGGGIFKSSWFELLDELPKFLCTFITADTAETDKTTNDPTVFSSWGLYEIEHNGRGSGIYGLHWLNCEEDWIAPKDLKTRFMSFYTHHSDDFGLPNFVAIEKKSTGVTLISVLQEVRGLYVKDIERTRASKSKVERYLEAQPYVARRQISFSADAEHLEKCRNHMSNITDNNTHAHDDIADTLYDAVKIALINKSLVTEYKNIKVNTAAMAVAAYNNKINKLRDMAWQ
jgi:hypothetical protein